MSMSERTGWRDELLSARHREWGSDCPMVDIDWFVVEYNHRKAVAFVDYKMRLTPASICERNANIEALEDASDKAESPFLVVYYHNTDWWFQVFPVNAWAEPWFTPGEILSEREYVTKLYKMRYNTIRQHILVKLNTDKPS